MYERFAELLEKNNLTPSQVSRDTGIPTSTLSEWKSGKYQPKADKLLILARYFKTTVEYFLE